MEQPYRANTLIVKIVGMLPGASAEYTSLSMKTKVMHYSRTLINYAFLLHSAYLFGTPFLVGMLSGHASATLRRTRLRKVGVPNGTPMG